MARALREVEGLTVGATWKAEMEARREANMASFILWMWRWSVEERRGKERCRSAFQGCSGNQRRRNEESDGLGSTGESARQLGTLGCLLPSRFIEAVKHRGLNEPPRTQDLVFNHES